MAFLQKRWTLPKKLSPPRHRLLQKGWRALERIGKKPLLCLLGTFLLSGAVFLTQGTGRLPEEGSLLREGYGGSEKEYGLSVSGLLGEERETELLVRVAPREYTEEEAEEVFWRCAEELPGLMLGENAALSEVRQDLQLPKSLPDYGVRISWYPEDAELISYEGEVKNAELSLPVETTLKAAMTDGKHTGTYVFDVTVCPRLLTEEEALLSDFQKTLEKADLNQVTEDALKLPEEFAGRRLAYRLEQDHSAVWLLFLGTAAAALLSMKARTEGAREQKKREEELLMDYSELVSKLIVYLGAGLTIRNAWERILRTYEEMQRKGLVGERAVYEEMRRTCEEMQKGIPEGKAYQNFGRRCRLQPFIKLCALLEQNRKNGGRNLCPLLQAEMDSAFEERKNAAKRRGEEAGTRLLLPLFMMLIIVMVIVILPAMLSMGG